MKTMAIIGAQWGDEGKGKFTDFFAQKADLVVRFQGGNNAGHTIIVGDKKIVTHLIPSGILHRGVVSVIGHGVVFDPRAFLVELEQLRSTGIDISPENLKISNHANVITSYNLIMDSARESGGKIKIGTTAKGIGPTYEDKVGRRVIKVGDLFDKKRLISRLENNLVEKKVLFENLYHVEYPSVEQEAEELLKTAEIIKPYVIDSFAYIADAVDNSKRILFEGAQGVLLDIDYGSYPFVTSSNTSVSSVYSGAGLGRPLDEVMGIVKAYTTRVGEGPFPTELFDEDGEKLQRIGHEFGATTGRTRRCGWLDLPMLKYAVRASKLTSIVLTKLDVLSEMDTIKVCTSYKYEGNEYDMGPLGIDMSRVEPVYETLPSFDINDKEDPNLKQFISKIESHLGIPVGIISFGPERNQLLMRREYF